MFFADIPRRTVQEWCLKNEFELIEFNPEVVSDDESVEDDFQETTGSLRIFQALQAHEWPDMQLKGDFHICICNFILSK